jgi:hypothetical protein
MGFLATLESLINAGFSDVVRDYGMNLLGSMPFCVESAGLMSLKPG